MMFELRLYMQDGKAVHYAKVDENELNEFRAAVNDDTSPNYVEVYCHNSDCGFGINRENLDAYSYKEADDE